MGAAGHPVVAAALAGGLGVAPPQVGDLLELR